MDKSTIFFGQLLILGALIGVTTAGVIAEYHDWPEPNPEINQFPHETTCHYYYLVLSEDDITVNKCPDGELFDYKDHKCASKETARCWSRHFGKMKHHHMKLKSRGHFRCPYAWGKYPDIKDCTRYYVCLSGKVKHKKCAPFEHFDKVSRKCVAAIDGVCADQTDIGDPDYHCPRSWGSFAYSGDCSKYYECLEKRPSLRTCPSDTLFHERKEKCVHWIHVHCGSRNNPYRKQGTIFAKPENSRVTATKPKVSSKENKAELKNEIISDSKSTPDPNSIIIEKMPPIPVKKATRSENNVVTPTQPKVLSLEKKSDIENNLVPTTKPKVSSIEKKTESENNLVSATKPEVSSVEKKTESNNNLVPTTKPEVSSVEKKNESENNLAPAVKPKVPSLEKKTESETKIISEPKVSTIDPLSSHSDHTQTLTHQTAEELLSKSTENKESKDLPVKENVSNKESTDLPAEKNVSNKESTDLPVEQTVSNKESTDLPLKQTVSNKESTDLPVNQSVHKEEPVIFLAKPKVVILEPKDMPVKKIVPNKESDYLSPTHDVSYETETVKINTEIISINDTDEVTDEDSGSTDEFIEISTIEAKSSSQTATQTVVDVDDSTQKPKAAIVEVKDKPTTADIPQATTVIDECSPKDPTCLTSDRGVVIRCPGAEGLFAYPGDERRYLSCEKSNIKVRFCPGVTIFNAKEKNCNPRIIF